MQTIKVKTSYTGCNYITSGKVYEVKVSGIFESMIADVGDKIDIVGPYWGLTCPHLNDEGYWEEVK